MGRGSPTNGCLAVIQHLPLNRLAPLPHLKRRDIDPDYLHEKIEREKAIAEEPNGHEPYIISNLFDELAAAEQVADIEAPMESQLYSMVNVHPP